MKILGIDPGVTTGYAVGDLDEAKGEMFVSPNQMKLHHQAFWCFIQSLAPDWIVCESFEYRNRARPGLELYSCELIGIVHLYVAEYKCGLNLQTASTAGAGGKPGHYFSNNKLKELDLYEAARPHAMDGLRHLLQWYEFGEGYQFNKNGFKPLWMKTLTQSQ